MLNSAPRFASSCLNRRHAVSILFFVFSLLLGQRTSSFGIGSFSHFSKLRCLLGHTSAAKPRKDPSYSCYPFSETLGARKQKPFRARPAPYGKPSMRSGSTARMTPSINCSGRRVCNQRCCRRILLGSHFAFVESVSFSIVLHTATSDGQNDPKALDCVVWGLAAALISRRIASQHS